MGGKGVGSGRTTEGDGRLLTSLGSTVSAGISGVVELGKAVVTGNATIPQVVALAVSVLGIVGIVVSGILGFRGDANQVVTIFLSLVGLGALASVLLLLGTLKLQASKTLKQNTTVEIGDPNSGTLEEKLRDQNIAYERIKRHMSYLINEITKIAAGAESKKRTGNVKESQHCYTIEADGTCIYERTSQMHAVNNIHMLLELASAEYDTKWWELDFVAKISGRKVSTLIAKNLSQEKQFAIFPLPEIEAGEDFTIDIQWKWEKAWHPLITGESDTWMQVIESQSPVPIVRFLFKIHPDLGPMNVENIGKGGGYLSSGRAPKDARGYRQVELVLEQVQPFSEIVLKVSKA